jgi:hypothetical protein
MHCGNHTTKRRGVKGQIKLTNPWFMEQKKIPTFTVLGTFCTHTFNHFLNIYLPKFDS